MSLSALSQGNEHRIVELSFCLNGRAIPVDHGYALYAALNRLVPELHSAKGIGVQPIRGAYYGNGMLYLTGFSRLVLRLPDDQIWLYLKLAGKKLEVDGHPLRVGVSEVRALRPAPTLYSRLVTIKGFVEPETFLAAVKRQLQERVGTADLRLGERRTLRVKDKRVVGFETIAEGLNAENSLKLQDDGLGGRRRFGCGVFVPYGGKL